MKRIDTGKRGEELARDFLIKRGFRILDANYRCTEGEIDIISQYKDCLVFTEVRTKTSQQFGSPEESITYTKKRRLITTAQHYLQNHGNQLPLCRIDFIAVELDGKGKLSRIELIENAVDEN
ncbi:MAG: YraN family protein [Chloroflexota bacterium]